MLNEHDCTVAEPVLERLAKDGECFGWIGVVFKDGSRFGKCVERLVKVSGEYCRSNKWYGLEDATADDYHALCSRLEDWLSTRREFLDVGHWREDGSWIIRLCSHSEDGGTTPAIRKPRKLDALVAACMAVLDAEEKE